MGKGKVPVESLFQKMQDFYLIQEKKVLKNFKSKIFLTKNLDIFLTPNLNLTVFDTSKPTKKNELKNLHLKCMKMF